MVASKYVKRSPRCAEILLLFIFLCARAENYLFLEKENTMRKNRRK